MDISNYFFSDCIIGKHGKKAWELTKACLVKFLCQGTVPEYYPWISGGSACARAQCSDFCLGATKSYVQTGAHAKEPDTGTNCEGFLSSQQYKFITPTSHMVTIIVFYK